MRDYLRGACGRWRFDVRLVAIIVLAASGCTMLDGRAVGRTDRLMPSRPYIDYDKAPLRGRFVTVPLTLDPVSGEAFNLQGRGDALQPLLQALNTALADARCCRHDATARLPGDGWPAIYVGSLAGDLAPAGSGIERQSYEEYPPMILHTTRPSDDWAAAVSAIARQAGAEYVLVVQLAFAQYPKSDRGYFGKKVVLGSGYEQDVRVPGAVDKPIEVLQLTGIVLDAEGSILRAGAEGIAGYDAPFWTQVLELGKDIDTDAIDRLVRSERRGDLPGRPLKWRAALDQLLSRLTT